MEEVQLGDAAAAFEGLAPALIQRELDGDHSLFLLHSAWSLLP
jgi:hypothetical protein